MSTIYLDDLAVSPQVGLSIPLTAIHIFFLASFLLPAMYLAWRELSEDDLRTNRAPMWLGLSFALATVILCLLSYRYFLPARIYLGIYGALAAVVAGLRTVAALATRCPDDDSKEPSAIQDEPGPQGRVGAGGASPGKGCQPRLVDQLGSVTPGNRLGVRLLHSVVRRLTPLGATEAQAGRGKSPLRREAGRMHYIGSGKPGEAAAWPL